MSSDKVKVEKVLVPNVTISACKLRRSYRGRYGLQYGAHLSGDGLAEIGLKPADDGGYWYSTNAQYGSTDIDVAPISIQDMKGNEVSDDLQNGSIAHLLFEVRHYGAYTAKDGTKVPAGKKARLSAVRATDFKVKGTKQDELTAMLLEAGIAAEQASDSPF